MAAAAVAVILTLRLWRPLTMRCTGVLAWLRAAEWLPRVRVGHIYGFTQGVAAHALPGRLHEQVPVG